MDFSSVAIELHMQADIIKVVTDICDALPSTLQKEVVTHLNCCVMKCDNI